MRELAGLRAVVDTNLLVRGALRRKPQAVTVQLYEAILARRVQLVTSAYILGEVRKTFRSPEIQRMAPLPTSAIELVIDGLRGVAEMVRLRYKVDLVPTDPRDNPIVATALQAGVEYLVTDDRHDLLPLKAIRLKGHRVVQVVGPGPFLALLREHEG